MTTPSYSKRKRVTPPAQGIQGWLLPMFALTLVACARMPAPQPPLTQPPPPTHSPPTQPEPIQTASPAPTPTEGPTAMPTAQPEETIIDETTLDLTYAHVVHVVATEKELGMWRFDVTLRSGDTGWDKYADQWEVLGPDGEVLATRVLMHPHVNEQPFTRSLDDVVIPPGVTQVTVLARDSVAGYGGQQVIVDLTQASGPGYEVHRQPEE